MTDAQIDHTLNELKILGFGGDHVSSELPD